MTAAPHRPLQRVRSLKAKLSIVIVAAVAVSTSTSLIGFRLGWPLWVRPLVAASLGLVLAQALGRGMTRPLRDMAAATRTMAAGDYSTRVQTASVDEVGQLAVAFNTMAERLAEADRLRRELVANVSHELRTPLSGLQATLENLVDGVAPPEPAVLGTMLAQTNRLSALVRDLLDLSRLEAGDTLLRPERLAVADLVDAVVLEAQLRYPELIVDSAIEPADLELQADPARLHQVLANLLDNAARYGGVELPVRIDARRRDDSVELAVVDLGPGLADADMERVFDRYARGSRPVAGRTSGRGGIGLGLAIARWIVELHGGAITVRANQPRGCRFVVSLPA